MACVAWVACACGTKHIGQKSKQQGEQGAESSGRLGRGRGSE